MAKAPGYRRSPSHKIEEQRLQAPVQVAVAGQVIASSSDVILLREDGYPDRYYFPRADVDMRRMERSASTSTCPFKGGANYYTLDIGDRALDDAAWTYENPYDEHAALKDRVAFYDDKFPEIEVTR